METLSALFAPAHFRLARVRSESGDNERALEHYDTFLDAFIDPDPDYEWMVEEARAAVSAQRG